MKNHFLVLLMLLITSGAQATPVLDSLWNLWENTDLPDTTRLNAIHSYAWDAYLNSQPDSTIYFAQIEYDYAESVGDKLWMSRALNTQGVAQGYLGNYSESLKLHTRSLELREELGLQADIAASLNNLGNTHRRLGETLEALSYFKRSLAIKEAINDKQGLFSAILNIGNLYSDQGDLETAYDFYLRSYDIAKELNNPRSIALNLIHLGTYHGQKSEYDEALAYFLESMNIYEELEDIYNVAGLSYNLGFLMVSEGNVQEGIKYFNQSLGLRQEIGDRGGEAATLASLGMSYYSLNNYPRAIDLGSQALLISQEIGDIRTIKDASEDLFRAYKKSGDYRKALEMYELSVEMRDSVLNEENQRALIQQQYQYQYEKQKTIDQLENEKQLLIASEKQQQQRVISIAIGLVLVLSLIFALILYRRLQVSRIQAIEIKKQKQRAEQSERHKEQFLANMSHEIRTPMHAISGMVKILERNQHLSEQEKFLKAMQVSSDNLTVLLDDILDLSKIEAGKIEVEEVPFQPREVIENVRQMLVYKAEEKGLELKIEIDPQIPEFLLGDPTRLSQVLTNLAGNSIKFTNKGSVSIIAKRKSEFLICEVHDTGIGIPKDKLYTIFDAFEQAKGSTSRNFGGTGLGLNISKQLVELQKGNIWAESEEGQGSTFFVSLPLVTVDEGSFKQELMTEEQIEKMASHIKGARILIAEDNPFNQMIVKDDLEYFVKDLTLKIVDHGQLAVEQVKSNAYDLVLMDVQMPRMDGYEATTLIRDWERQQNQTAIPIIAMTASLLKTEVSLCFEAGMNDYIPKPYQIQELIKTIYGAMQKNNSATIK